MCTWYLRLCEAPMQARVQEGIRQNFPFVHMQKYIKPIMCCSCGCGISEQFEYSDFHSMSAPHYNKAFPQY